MRNEFKTYEDFGSYHFVQLDDDQDESFVHEFAVAFVGFGLIMFALWQTVGF